ncbi:DEAD/DEAH box helicase [Bacteroidales bacterium OttesenSCG-928-B11]|nr:DEAD/DEAH box helicase [Bacteroidales bacterium OttesenSCG-928-E04]MDL2312905.1 DEAD/DEAH box helicase [Bacteroidales bacterium OttesenSCG-928-B11]MDL2326389.1 DEAD/DEAH box helicase [Bacteroidales bacterium OttesenSCG-928-A14]
MITFREMGLSPELVKAVEELGFERAMPVQEETIPEILSYDRDLIALAQTGTGKTAAFGLPILQQLDTLNKNTEALILSPTRELCMQIANDLQSYSKYLPGVSIVPVYGGASIENQKKELKKGAKIIVATPGRLLDLIRRKYIDINHITTLVLDEADEMLDMGFKDDLDDILANTPATKRTFLFSATMPPEVEAISRNYMTDPKEITVGTKNSGTENVSHFYYLVSAQNRYLALKRVVDYYPRIYAIVFCKTKAETQEVATSLIQDGYNADALHGDLSQAQRDHVMRRFRCKNLQILVATDVAARGLDVNNLTHVINYNLPAEAEQYNHRSGRTGRANKLGMAISIVTPREAGKIRKIEDNIKQELKKEKIPTGQEICEKQLFHMVDEMEKVNVNYTEIESFLPVILKKLAWMDKEELIRRFVSVEFNRFLDYYRDVKDIDVANAEESRKKKREEREKPARKTSANMTRLYFGLGYCDRVNPQRLIALINETTQNRDVKIGKIDIFEDETYIDIDSDHAQEVINSFEGATYKNFDLVVKIAKRQQKDSFHKPASSPAKTHKKAKEKPFYDRFGKKKGKRK